jgi:rubrerythrin
MRIILAALIVGILLVAYVMLEKRINQRACAGCGFRVSIDGLDEDCPRCGSLIPKHLES